MYCWSALQTNREILRYAEGLGSWVGMFWSVRHDKCLIVLTAPTLSDIGNPLWPTHLECKGKIFRNDAAEMTQEKEYLLLL
jgi:hypothetical protein